MLQMVNAQTVMISHGAEPTHVCHRTAIGWFPRLIDAQKAQDEVRQLKWVGVTEIVGSTDKGFVLRCFRREKP